ncbi:helix-turn-helix domain-containing protein [uncultured Rhodoblastus sp.]|uniref:helix-turn-helix domain-containing protein n=1 Tax=uncultured Rhodoblastus sp. TaxID=543037 RepID=UPI0025FF67BF|nr:helix-turn-helix domain-containing protein [uncultured Rhodoblastus sp.]
MSPAVSTSSAPPGALAQPSTPKPIRAPGGSLAAWGDMVAGIFDIAANKTEAAHFKGEFLLRAAGSFLLSEASSSGLRLVRSLETIHRGGVDGFAVRLQLSGAVEGRMGDAAVQCGDGGVLFIDLMQTLDLRVLADEAPASDITLWIPRGKILSALDDESLWHGFTLAGGAPAAAVIGGNLKLFAQQAERLTARELDGFLQGFVAMIGKAASPLFDRARKPLASFVSIRRHIDQNLRSPALDAEALARTFGLSRASLYRLFEPVGGVASYIRGARLNRAYQDIVATELSNRRIAPVAYRLGFKNLSAFNRLFKQTYGVSPGEARHRALHGLADIRPGGQPDPELSLGGWLRRLGKRSPET